MIALQAYAHWPRTMLLFSKHQYCSRPGTADASVGTAAKGHYSLACAVYDHAVIFISPLHCQAPTSSLKNRESDSLELTVDHYCISHETGCYILDDCPD